MRPRFSTRSFSVALALATTAMVPVSACDSAQDAPPGGFPDTSTPIADTVPPDTADTTTTELDTTPEPERPAHCTGVIVPGPAPLRRLTKNEYSRSLRQLLGIDSNPGDALPPEEETYGFDNNASGRGVTQIHVERYMLIAETLIKEALDTRRSTIIKCDPYDISAELCARQTIRDFGRLAYRRRLSTDELERYVTYFNSLYPTEGFDQSIAMILEVMLQSPWFLYRVELGLPDDDGDGVVALTGNELATRLSYLLWGGPPDDYLLAAAEVGLLETKEGLANEARRMLADEKARDAILHFHRQWLELTKLDAAFKDPALFPEYNEALKTRLRTETERFVDQVIWQDDGDLTTLLSASWSMLDPTLAEHYGVDYPYPEAPAEGAPPSRPGFTKVELDAHRKGLLTHASILTIQAKYNQTSPVLRGKFVREQLLCQHLAPPPADINITPPDLDPNLTTRERFRQHADSEECAGCHKKMDPVGLTFEHYDALGRWRETEGGLQIDPSGELLFTWDVNGPVANAMELIERLASSEEVRHCYSLQWFRYTHGRDAAYADECTMFDLMEAFEAGDWKIQDLLVALTQTDAFRYRPLPIPGGGSGVP